mmetsp:Transcript_23282/g.31091  ORF Transcript_23282/g.31091 Transcript_23282/m.31091 type:complete len:92 (+) Transcript_23282:773-1048(+)
MLTTIAWAIFGESNAFFLPCVGLLLPLLLFLTLSVELLHDLPFSLFDALDHRLFHDFPLCSLAPPGADASDYRVDQHSNEDKQVDDEVQPD